MLALLALLAMQVPAEELGFAPHSVLLVVADDVGWSEMPHMPALQGLASQGMTFERFYAQPVCTITRIALLYGELPRRFGVGDLLGSGPTFPRIPAEAVSVAELLGSTHKSALFGKWHCGRADWTGGMNLEQTGPLGQGWETCRAVNLGGFVDYDQWSRMDNGNMTTSPVYVTDAQRAQTVAYWNNRPGPKIVHLAWSAAHVILGGTYPGYSGSYPPPPGQSATGTQRGDYLQIVAHMDQAFATVLAAVDLETTYVFWCGDNGTPQDVPAEGVNGLTLKGTTCEGGVRVPLVVAGPGIAHGVTSQRLVSALDIGATLAALFGRDTRGMQDSMSFADALVSGFPGEERDWVFCERYRDVQDEQAVIEAQWKLRRVDPDGDGQQPSTDCFYFISAPGVEVELTPSQSTQDRLLAELASLPPRA